MKIRLSSPMLFVSILFLVSSATSAEVSGCTFTLGYESSRFLLKKTDTPTTKFQNGQSTGNTIANLDFTGSKEYVCCRQSSDVEFVANDCFELSYVSNPTPTKNEIIQVGKNQSTRLLDDLKFTSSADGHIYYHEDDSNEFAFCKLEVSSDSNTNKISITIKQSSAMLFASKVLKSETDNRLAYDYKNPVIARYSDQSQPPKYYFVSMFDEEIPFASLQFSVDGDSGAITVDSYKKASLQGVEYFIRGFQTTLNTRSSNEFYPDLNQFSIDDQTIGTIQSLSIDNLQYYNSSHTNYQMKVLQGENKLLVLENSKKSLALIDIQKSSPGFKLLHNISNGEIQLAGTNTTFVTLKATQSAKTLSISMMYRDAVNGKKYMEFIPYNFPLVGEEKTFPCFVSRTAENGFTLNDENFSPKTTPDECLTDKFVFQHKGNNTVLNSTDLQVESIKKDASQQYKLKMTHKRDANYVFQEIDVDIRTLDDTTQNVTRKTVKYLRRDTGWLNEISFDQSPIKDRALEFQVKTDKITSISRQYSFSEHSLSPSALALIALLENKDTADGLHVNIFRKNELRQSQPDCLRVGPNTYEARVESLNVNSKCKNFWDANKKIIGGGVVEIEFNQPECKPTLRAIDKDTATFFWEISGYPNSTVTKVIQLNSGSETETEFACRNRFSTDVSKTTLTSKIVQNDSGLEIGSFDFLEQKFETNQSGFELRESLKDGFREVVFHRITLPAITLEYKAIEYVGRRCIPIPGADMFLMEAGEKGRLATEKECRIDPNIRSKAIRHKENSYERSVSWDNTMKIYPKGKKLSGDPYIELNLEENSSIDQLIQGKSKYFIQKETNGIYKDYKVFIFPNGGGKKYLEMVNFKSMLFLRVLNLGIMIFVCIAFITFVLYLKHRGDSEMHIEDYRYYCRSLLNSSSEASSIPDQNLPPACRVSTKPSQFDVGEFFKAHPISDAPQLYSLAQSVQQNQGQMQNFVATLEAAHNRRKKALAGRTASKQFELIPYESPNLPITVHMLRGTKANVDANSFKRLFKMAHPQLAVVQRTFLDQFGRDSDSTTRDCVMAKLDAFPSCNFIGADSITDRCLLAILNLIENEKSISSILLLHIEDMDSHILAAAIESISKRTLIAASYVVDPLSKAISMAAFAEKDLEPEASIHFCKEVFRILKEVKIEPFFELKKQMKEVQNHGNPIWREITRIRTHSTQIGKLTANHKFNRYSDIVPYDHSRVVLNPPLNGSDYINASHIDISLNGRSYHFYALQAPLEHTVDAFWSAIWQQEIACMVKLTRNKERGVNKCFEYVPFKGQASKLDERGFTFRVATDDCGSQITITLLAIAEFPNITVQLFRMSSEQTDTLDDTSLAANRQAKTIYHTNIAFNAWADHGVPSMSDLERLLYLCINPATAMPDINPHVHECMRRAFEEQKFGVHCSAGVGRTGVFIALMIVMYEAGKGCREFNMANCVDQMRDCRNTMVQTADQFKCLYEYAANILLNGREH